MEHRLLQERTANLIISRVFSTLAIINLLMTLALYCIIDPFGIYRKIATVLSVFTLIFAITSAVYAWLCKKKEIPVQITNQSLNKP